MSAERRPERGGAAEAGKASEHRVPPDGDKRGEPRRRREFTEAEWLIHDAETIVLLEARAIEVLRGFTTPQLRALVWAGLVDDGWRRLLAELDRRGEDL